MTSGGSMLARPWASRHGLSMVFSSDTRPEKISIEQAKNGVALQDSSHTPQGAFGYLLSQIEPRPQLKAAAQFPVSDDTVNCAIRRVAITFPTR